MVATTHLNQSYPSISIPAVATFSDLFARLDPDRRGPRQAVRACLQVVSDQPPSLQVAAQRSVVVEGVARPMERRRGVT
jgi:hypothetical protein